MHRLFFAFTVPPSVRQYACRLQDALRRHGVRGRWVRAESMHLTVLFLGEQADEDMPGIIQTASAYVAGLSGFSLDASRVTAFSRTPRLLYLAFAEAPGKTCFEQAARGLHTMLDRARVLSRAVSLPRRAVPHLTLVRFRGTQEQRTLDGIALRETGNLVWDVDLPLPPADAVVPCERLVLFRSILSPEGPRYDVIEEFELHGTPE